MDDFGMLTRDFGFRPQGKSAPMKGGVGSDGGDRCARSSSTTTSPFADDQNSDGMLFTDVFGGPPKYASQGSKPSSMPDFDYDSIFKGSATNETKSKSTATSSVPVYDKPVYDEDIFDGLPGLKSKSMSSSARYEENVFASMASPPKQSDHFDDLLGNLGRNKSSRGFDDLLPGFGSGSPTVSNRPTSERKQPSKPSGNSNKKASDVMDDPFVILESTSTTGVSSTGLLSDPLEEISKLSKSGTNANTSSASGGIFSDIDPLDGLGKSIPVFPSEMDNKGADGSSSRAGSSVGSTQNSTTKESYAKSSFKYSESHSQKKVPVEDVQDSRQTLFDMPSASTDSPKPFGETGYSPSFVNVNGSNSQADMSPRSEENVQQADDVWLYVSEVPLFTQPTSAPPPSRPPPPIPGRVSRSESARKKGNEFSSSANSSRYSQSRNPFDQVPKSSMASSIDELEAFAMDSTQNSADENAYGQSDAAASAAAMKEAMDRAEAKFRHAKEVREREYAKSGRTKEAVQLEKDEEPMPETREGEFRENQDIFERRQKEEEERELKRAEKERVRARESEREKARQAVERATREARERAAVDARERAATESRLKSERAAVQRAQAEARERAAADARGRAERAATEARERSNAEAREKEAREKAAVARAEAESRRRTERAAVDRVAAEARERAAVDARDRAAAAARMNQQKNDDDLESFFSSRASSVPRPRASTSDPVLDPQFQSRGGPEVAKRTSSSGVPSNMRKASSTTNTDDLSSLFGVAASSSGDFQDVDGETEERRRARLERHHRTQERAAKALAEKNQRDLQAQKDQEERHRIADTLDIEIKRWAAGKEGNLRALLSTLQYVLWPECGWQPVSLTDLIMGASVKKVYRKATLCIHPDKVQQKGANLQQKYVAEKVFDLLKEAWNKFNSEELF